MRIGTEKSPGFEVRTPGSKARRTTGTRADNEKLRTQEAGQGIDVRNADINRAGEQENSGAGD